MGWINERNADAAATARRMQVDQLPEPHFAWSGLRCLVSLFDFRLAATDSLWVIVVTETALALISLVAQARIDLFAQRMPVRMVPVSFSSRTNSTAHKKVFARKRTLSESCKPSCQNYVNLRSRIQSVWNFSPRGLSVRS